MNLEELIKQKIDSYKDDFDFRLEAFIFDLTERISKRMKDGNISRSKLAELLGISPPAVTKILNGNSNFTLKTLLSLADALDLELKVEFIEKKAVSAKLYDYKPLFASANEQTQILISYPDALRSYPTPIREKPGEAKAA